MDGKLIEVRATIHLAKLPLGATAMVDPKLPAIAEYLRAGYIVPTGHASVDAGPAPPAAPEPSREGSQEAVPGDLTASEQS